MPGIGCSDLEALRVHVGDCHRCPLGFTRTQVVFGVGDVRARVMFIGEAPGKSEDLKGEPFVGAAGQLLNELLGHAGLRREEVYIANVLKCRPPGNRDPELVEIETCTPFLREQIRLIGPEILVTLGNFATKFVLKTETGITRLHGCVRTAGRFTVLPIFHPAAAIYDRTKRDALLADFEKLRELLVEPSEVTAESGEGSEDEHGGEPKVLGAADYGSAHATEAPAGSCEMGEPLRGAQAGGAEFDADVPEQDADSTLPGDDQPRLF